jgi:hypothetical protein
MDSDSFLRSALFVTPPLNPYDYCHHPVVVRDTNIPLGEVLLHLKLPSGSKRDHVIDRDIILVWGKERRVITGADILGRLLRGIVSSDPLNSLYGEVILFKHQL